MRSAIFLGALVLACGGATDNDLNGSGGAAGSAGNGATSSGGSAAGGSGGASGGSAGSGAVGGIAGAGAIGGAGGSGGFAAAPGCCTSSKDCASWASDPSPVQCVNGVCKDPPPPGTCWNDTHCQAGLQGACVGASVCPCDADCDGPDQPGTCVTVGPGCCQKNSDCPATSAGKQVCVAGNCELAPKPGQCWYDSDCGPGGLCGGSCICPCGAICACGGQMGKCLPKPPPACCASDFECLGIGLCAGGTCKEPIKGKCWKDSECGPGATCEGEVLCPCGAMCAAPDSPGTCVKKS